jgi:hypothetical protein
MHHRLRAVCDLSVAGARESAGLHAYDGVVQDLSPGGVRAGLARLGGDRLADAHDDAALACAEQALRVEFGELAEHRRNPLYHLANLDLACYDREYAPAAERADARRRHLEHWPDAIDVAIATLDEVPPVVARGLLGSAQGLAVGLEPGLDPVVDAGLAALERLLDHLRAAGAGTGPGPGLGAAELTRLLSAGEALEVDLGKLAERADRERDRLVEILTDACAHLCPGARLAEAVATLQADHPTAESVLDEARALTAEVLLFTRDSGLVGEHDGSCRVGPAPASRGWAMAMLSWAAPFEEDGPSWYYVTPPDPAWAPERQRAWLEVFNRSSLPAITVHEVAPGHFTHGRFLRRAPGDVRKVVRSDAFVEGWAHYVEELVWEEGFRRGDPHYVAGMAIEALIRVTRLAASIGVHSGAMTLEEAERRFVEDAFIHGPAAASEAVRATFDPTYGRYTWGKLALLDLRDRARRAWGAGYTHRRLHDALLALGAPPLGLIDHVLD